MIEIIEEEPIGVLIVIGTLILIAGGISYMWNSYYAQHPATVTSPAYNNSSLNITEAVEVTSQPVYEIISNVSPDVGAFKREENTDWPGVYYGNKGACEIAYLDIDEWERTSGKMILVPDGEDPTGLYTYTRFGLDSQVRYDEYTNTVYSIIPDPWAYEREQEYIKEFAKNYV